MMAIIKHISKCLQSPYFVLLAITALVALRKKDKRILAVFSLSLFFVCWRAFLKLESSRYYSIFLVYIVICIVYLFSQFKNKTLVNVLLCFLFCYNIIKLNTGFRNNYILDLQDDIRTILKSDQNRAIIYIKEYNRLFQAEYNSNHQEEYSYGELQKDIEDHYVQKSMFYYNLFFVLPEYSLIKNKKNADFYYSYVNKSFIKIRNYYTNFNHKSNISILFHPPFIPTPACELTEDFKDAVLKAWDPGYDVFVYQIGNKLVWLIGSKIDEATEVVYHIRTNKPNLLPISRLQYRFDNRGFRLKNIEKHYIGKYMVFEKEIPSEYPITSVTVGFNADGTKLWKGEFYVDQNNRDHILSEPTNDLK